MSSLRNIEEYYMEGEIPTKRLSLETDLNTKETDKICLYMIYQADTTDYINIFKEFKKNLLKSYTVVWEFFNKKFQN